MGCLRNSWWNKSNACYHGNFLLKIIRRRTKPVPFLALNSSFALVIESRWPSAVSSHVPVISSDMPHGQILSAIYIRSNPFFLRALSVLVCEKYRVVRLLWKQWTGSDFIRQIQSRAGSSGVLNLNPLFVWDVSWRTAFISVLIEIASCHSLEYHNLAVGS
jgi:uncharacterized protein with NRDE domain